MPEKKERFCEMQYNMLSQMHPSRQFWVMMDEQFGNSNSSGTHIQQQMHCLTVQQSTEEVVFLFVTKENKLLVS